MKVDSKIEKQMSSFKKILEYLNKSKFYRN